MKSLDQYWNSINFISLVLLPLSVIFYLISRFRKLAYQIGITASYKSPVPVIVVGNISVGGTGKTPLIIELVKQLQALGKKPGVISRGYGGAAHNWPQMVNEKSNAKTVGDEPQLIFQRTKCPFVAGPNRRDDIELLLKEFACDVVLSDDGLQHYAMQRDIEIAVVDAKRKFGNGFCLPSGPLRETVSRLKQVDLVLLNGGSGDEMSFNMQAADCYSIGDNQANTKSLSFFSDKTVHAIAGIGNPSRFFSMLEKNNINVISHEFEDHYNFKQSDICFDDNLPVLMTEKDAIKCGAFTLKNTWAVPVKIQLSESAQNKLNIMFSDLKI
ncbi:Tetraacyldisaccharide 4'-kinase [hydrothermal vent metagenome]|uniref:tetraacyldisaccharide 4'-kinase n=1 Tax=hydrothermal vent metagenome TaxID=652676 RepID=A0A3B0X9B1_9ZZZZ